MIVITDSNLIISALISPNGIVASIFKDKGNLQFTAPNYLKEEIVFHWDKILKHSSLSLRELNQEWKFLQNKIKFVSADDISDEMVDKAYELVKDIDPNDVFFVALHFFIKHKIWTGDKILINGLKNKGYDICITTEELKNLLYKKSPNE